jgi:hypothetical protein
LSKLQRQFRDLPEDVLIGKIIKLQNQALDMRLLEHKRGIRTPSTVIKNRNGDILYIEDGDDCREAVTKDSDYANFYLNPNCTGLSYYKSGMMRHKPLPSKK